MAKKWKRIKVALVSTESGKVNYITYINKENTPKLEIMKFDPHPNVRRHVLHVSKDKLK